MKLFNHSLSQSGLRWLWLAVVIFIADIGIKYYVLENIGFGWKHRIEVLPFFNILHVHNYGAAFSFLSDQPGWQRWFFAVIALSISSLLLFWLRKQSKDEKQLNIAYCLIVGGALGNLYDRLVHGFVVDYLDVYVGTYHWPAFNLADAAICIGAFLLVLDGFKQEKEERKGRKKEQ